MWESPAAFLLILLLIGSIGGHGAAGPRRQRPAPIGSWAWSTPLLQVGGLVFVFLVASDGGGHASATTAAGCRCSSSSSWSGWSAASGASSGSPAYFWATNILGYHGNEVYAPLHHEDLKNFLRLHIDADGGLTIYPVGIDRVGRHWKLRPEGPARLPVVRAATATRPSTHLIEPPIRIKGRG